MLKLGRAQGVAIAAAISKGLPIHEYAPLKIKMAITGNGRSKQGASGADFEARFLHKDENMLPYLDATDALGAAYCHFLQSINSPKRQRKKTRRGEIIRTTSLQKTTQGK